VGARAPGRINTGGEVGARAPGRINTLFQPFKNVFLSRNLDQNVPKNAYFLAKAVKIAAASMAPNPRWPRAAGDSAPRSPRYYSRQLFAKAFFYDRKRIKLL